MRLKTAASIAAALFAATLTATPAAAATRPRPATITASSYCLYGTWHVRLSITTSRVGDLWSDSDYGPRLLRAGLPAGPTATVVDDIPGAMAQKVEYRVQAAGTGFDQVDPWVTVQVFDPAQYDVHAGC